LVIAGPSLFCQKEQYDRYISDRHNSGFCREISNSFECARAIEKTVLPNIPGAHRQSRSLRLMMRDGSTVRFEDKKDSTSYSLRGLFLRDFYVVEIQEIEGGHFQILQFDTGNSIETIGPPIASPSENLFITANVDVDAAYTANGIELWAIKQNKPVFLTAYSGPCGPDGAKWKSQDTIQFHCVCFPPDSIPECNTTVTLSAKKKNWGQDSPLYE
ncbi:MAG: hypothetical protein KDK33_12660, partial [Leptospiraceae bacterium]|nr:hypothetical protein [Leptospiraceae bacterium]